MKRHKSKRNRVSKRQKSKKNRTKKSKPYTPIKLKLFETPDPFGNLPREERLKILIEIGKNADRKFRQDYLGLRDWYANYDALYLLSFCLFYFFASEEGIDEEAIKGKMNFYPHYLELLQAFALMQDCNPTPRPLLNEAKKLRENIESVMSAYSLRSFADITEDISEEEFKKRRTINEIRAQTVAVRNPAFSNQIINGTKKLFAKISNTFESYYKVDPLKLVDALLMKVETINSEYNSHLKKVASFYKEKSFEKFYEAYSKAFYTESDKDDLKTLFISMGNNLNHLKNALVTHSDLFLSDFLTLTADEFAFLYGEETKTQELNKILNLWSLSFGDLANANPEHFILDNPVLKKPLIKLDEETYFSSIFGIIYHIIPIIMEGLVREMGTLAIQKYQKAKAQLLEEETERLFKEYFPNSQIFQGSKWIDGETGKEYENDLLIIIDRFAFVVECKSSTMDAPARRGGELRIVDTLKSLVVDAAQQANRFISYLSANPGKNQFSKVQGQINNVDTTKVNFYIPLSITFENLGMVSANLKQCVESGLIKGGIDSFIPSICWTDLEVILTTLENEIERIHYLVRRSQIERDLFYIGDEIDLLAFYLDTGFNLGNDEEPGKIGLQLLMKSKELAPFFLAKENGIKTEKPKLALTKWWVDIINYLIKRKPEYWTEMGYVFLNVPKNDQKRFERKFKNLQARAKVGIAEHPHTWVILETLPKNRSYIIAGFPYLINNSEKRNEVIKNQILIKEVVTEEKLGAICLGISVERNHYPYSVLVFVPKEFIIHP